MNCPPPSHSMWVLFFCCVRAFFWIGYRIIEFIGHLSLCKKIYIFFYEDSEEKWGLFFFLFFFVGVQEKRNIYFTKKKRKKKKKKKW